MAKAQINFGEVGGGNGDFSIILDHSSSTGGYGTSHTITGKAGKKLLAFIYSASSNVTLYTTYDGATTNDGSTITKLCNEFPYDARGYGTFYQVDVATNSCTISHTTPCFALVFEKA